MTNQPVVLDSNVLVAFYNQTDSLHTKAVGIIEKLQQDQTMLVLSNVVLYEIITILSQKAGKIKARAFGALVYEEKPFAIVRATEQHEYRAWELFMKTKSKNVSFIDCIVIVMAKEYRYRIATYDQQLSRIAKKMNVVVY